MYSKSITINLSLELRKMRKFIAALLVLAILFPVWVPEAKAIDPVTMMVLAPIAIKVADAARPYIEKSLIGTGTGLLKIGKDVLHMLYLPYGLLEITFGAPFNKFRSGLVHILRGGVIAPIRLILHTLILPVYMTGAQINI